MAADKMRILFSAEEIQAKVIEIANEINKAYAPIVSKADDENYKKPVAICSLKGAVFFYADLMRALNFDCELDFIKLSSYGAGTESSGNVLLTRDSMVDLKDRDVLIIEDIVDSGHSMAFLRENLMQRGVKSVHVVALIDKHERREVDVKVDFFGFHLAEGFIVGYGLDYAEKYRSLPAIYEIIL